MTFREVEGDLFSLGLPAIGHGVNCRGVMGAGIARVFRDRYPGMYAAYRLLCQRGDIQPGEMMTWEVDRVTICNLATQLEPGADARLVHVEESVRAALRTLKKNKIKALGLPRIGCGIGGLEWADVKEIMERVSRNYPEVELVAVSLPS